MTICLAMAIDLSGDNAEVIFTLQQGAQKPAFGGDQENEVDYECAEVTSFSPNQRRHALKRNLLPWAEELITQICKNEEVVRSLKEGLSSLGSFQNPKRLNGSSSNSQPQETSEEVRVTIPESELAQEEPRHTNGVH